MKHFWLSNMLFLTLALIVSSCHPKKVAEQERSSIVQEGSPKNMTSNANSHNSRSEPIFESSHLSPPGFIHYGGVEELANDQIVQLIEKDGSLGRKSIRNLYQTGLSNSDKTFFLAITHDLDYDESVAGIDVAIFNIDGNNFQKKYDSIEGSLPYYDWYDGLRYKSNIPGDWVGCGFVGDFNGDDIYELLVFSALGMGFFMEVYEYDSESDSFRQTFNEELNTLSTELVQYGEAKGTKGFFLNNSTTNDWKKKNTMDGTQDKGNMCSWLHIWTARSSSNSLCCRAGVGEEDRRVMKRSSGLCALR